MSASAASVQAMAEDSPHAPDDPRTLHLRCGSDIHRALTEAGFSGRFLEFSDPYCQGPVRALAREDFLRERASFISRAYESDFDETLERLHGQYGGVDHVERFERVVLWFEHDSYDQLILAAVLDALAKRRTDVSVEMVCVDHVPGIDRFIGLGQLSPAQLAQLWHEQRRVVSDGEFKQGARVWDALRQGHPGALQALSKEPGPAMVIMTRAVRRHLQELPDERSGLALGQALVLEILDQSGPLSAGRIYRELMMEREPLPYLGDLMFRHVLCDLADAGESVYTVDADSRTAPWPRRELSITEVGRRVLNGDRDFLAIYRGRRWVGGVPVGGDAGAPRRAQQPVP